MYLPFTVHYTTPQTVRRCLEGWGTPVNLIMDAISVFAASENPVPDTGSLEGDLRQLLRNVVALLERPEVLRLFRHIHSLDLGQDSARQLWQQFWGARFGIGTQVIERAIQRGEVSHDVDGIDILEMLVGVTYVRAFLTGRPLDDSMIERAVRSVMDVAVQRGAVAEGERGVRRSP